MDSQHAGSDGAATVEYQSLSALAVVALVLGAASALMFVAPLFVILPVAAIGVALLAFTQIRKSGGALAGAGLARVGLALAVAFTAAAMIRDAIRDSLLQRQAGQAALQWFELLADGQFVEAREMLSAQGAGSLVPRSGADGPPVSEEEMYAIILDRLRTDPVTKTLQGEGDAGGKAFVEHLSPPVFEGVRTLVAGEFAVGVPGGSHRHVQLELARARAYEDAGRPWRIERWSSGDEHDAH